MRRLIGLKPPWARADKKLRDIYYSLEATEISHTNCRLNMNELIHNYYDTPKLFNSAREAIRYIKQKHKNILEAA